MTVRNSYMPVDNYIFNDSLDPTKNAIWNRFSETITVSQLLLLLFIIIIGVLFITLQLDKNILTRSNNIRGFFPLR